MGEEMMDFECLGVNKKWPKYKSVLVRLEKERKYNFDLTYKIISEYITREDAGLHKSLPNRRNITMSESEIIGRYKVDEVLAQAPDNLQCFVDLARWIPYYQVGIASNFFWHHRFRVIFPDHPNGGLRMFSMEYAAQMLGVMALLGWRDAAIYQGYLTHAALNHNYQLELQYSEEHRRGQAFMIRLFSDWVGDVSHAWPDYAYDEPVYEYLIGNWRNPDAGELVPALLAACDRHTYQTQKDSSKKFFDFQNIGLIRTPIEILFLFRLREWEGLENPILEHPLMTAPFDKLPPEQPVPPLDELMQAVLKRAREDWPEYDEVLSLAALKSG